MAFGGELFERNASSTRLTPLGRALYGDACALVAQAGGDRADPLARYVVDDEFGDLAHKEEGWANRIMFWRRDDAATQAPTAIQTSEGAVNVDAATEFARVQALTGGRAGISITPRRDTGFKLPGL